MRQVGVVKRISRAPRRILGAMLGVVLVSFSSPASAQSPAGDLAFDQEDMDFILAQIKFAERHAAGENLLDILPNASFPLGLRTVDGSFNSLIPGQETFGQSDQEFPNFVEREYTPAQILTFPLSPLDVVGQPTHYNQGDGRTVEDSTPRIISQLMNNQSVGNPAAVITSDEEGGENVGPDLAGLDQFFIPNTAPDEGLSAPINAFTTFFGQFFDHGLSLVNKGGNGFVYTPLQPDDPLFSTDPGAPNFMLLTRAELDAGPDGEIGTADDVSSPVNATTPHVDQNQTYTSHPSAQVLLRHYEVRGGRLQNTGRLLDGFGDDGILDNADDGGLPTWDTVQLQAFQKFGIDLDDFDGNNMPMILVDPYGNFIPGPDRELPQLVIGPGSVVEGNVAAPVDATQALRINHSFFLDVAHTANPNGPTGPLAPDPDAALNPLLDMLPDGRPVRGIRAAGPAGTYDDELLGAHFACGDGRCNENIVLTSIHTVFHREHNRLNDVAKRVILDTGDLATLNEWLDTPLVAFPAWGGLPFPISDASLANQTATTTAIDALNLDWNGQRVFQAAKFGTEMQYNRIVFDEFGPTLAGLKDVFEGFHTNIDPTIVGEFAHSVYRFGHSMLTETVDRYDDDFGLIGGEPQLFLFEAFLNPLSLYDSTPAGVSQLTPEQAVGAVVRGSTKTVSNEIDEFVTGALQNNVYGLPLDLGAINIQRGRDTGIPRLNAARRMFFADTADTRLTPYESWVDYLDNLRHESTIVNLIAAYGTHPSIAGNDGIVGNADDPVTTFAGRRAAACAIVGALTPDETVYCTDTGFIPGGTLTSPIDALDFLFSMGAWANGPGDVTITGLDDVDFWNGGLAEERMPFGGYLGSTHNYVFETQLESLQNGDRFYYVGRTANIHLFSELESNSFTALVMRNSDLGEEGAGSLSINIFAELIVLEVDLAEQFDADPVGTDLTPLVIRNPDEATTSIDVADASRFLQYTGGDHVTIGGTSGDDTIIGGIGDDSLWGRSGDDRIEGGDGADLIEGGPGDDIITDLSGPDVIEGGAGNDAISSGNEEDVIFGDEGQDFIVNSSEFGEIFAGLGNDFIFDGLHLGHIRGGAGDDWMENLGGGEDLWQGDNGAAAEAGEPSVKGHDVFIAHGGNNDADMENGDDIVVDGPGIERVEGQLGFDWVSFANDTFGVNIDLDLTIFLRPTLPPSNDTVLNRYDRVEGVSGSPLSDLLRGTANAPGTTSGNELTNFGLINGLGSLVPLSERVDLPDDPVTGETQFGWTGGEIIVGGGGSDLMVGEAGDDIIDGDSALHVELRAGGTSYAGMEELFDPVFSGAINPGAISIWREIADADIANDDTDTASFSGNRADYDVVDIGGFLRVTDIRPLPTNLPADRPGNDGSDLVRNVERLQFSDRTDEVLTGVAGSAGPNNSLATGEPTISGTPELGMELTALVGTLMDADNAGGVVNPAAIDWIWESELEPGSNFFQPIVRLQGTLGNGDSVEIHGNPFLVTEAEIGLQVRVVGLFQDDVGVFELARSAPVSIPIPPGFPVPPGVAAPAAFNGACAELQAITPTAENASRAGLARLDFTVPGVLLASFDNTAEVFPPGFGAGAEQLVSNLSLVFVNQGTLQPTGTFVPEIVAIQDPVTLVVDPLRVDILWSIRGPDVAPLVDGPTTVSFVLDGSCVFATAVLDGDSSVNDAVDVTVTGVNPPPGTPDVVGTVDALGDLSITGTVGAGNVALPDLSGVSCQTDANGVFVCEGDRLTAGTLVTISSFAGAPAWTGIVDAGGRLNVQGDVGAGNLAVTDVIGVICRMRGSTFSCRAAGLTPGRLVTVTRQSP